MNIALVVAGGKGLRLGADIPKQYLEVFGKPIIAWTLENLQAQKCIDKIVVVAAEQWHEYITLWRDKSNIDKLVMITSAGETRMESTLNGLRAIKSFAQNDDGVVLMDANRPLVIEETFTDIVNKITDEGSVSALDASYDTLLITNEKNEICRTVDRAHVWKAQTPEGAKLELMYEVYSSAINEGIIDQPMPVLMMHYGYHVIAAKGSPRNFKITTKDDMELFEAYLTLITKT